MACKRQEKHYSSQALLRIHGREWNSLLPQVRERYEAAAREQQSHKAAAVDRASSQALENVAVAESSWLQGGCDRCLQTAALPPGRPLSRLCTATDLQAQSTQTLANRSRYVSHSRISRRDAPSRHQPNSQYAPPPPCPAWSSAGTHSRTRASVCRTRMVTSRGAGFFRICAGDGGQWRVGATALRDFEGLGGQCAAGVPAHLALSFPQTRRTKLAWSPSLTLKHLSSW